jgi:hypothetical protein
MTTRDAPEPRFLIWALALTTLLVAVGFALTEAIPQDPDYHAFIDRRTLFGVPNFFDVVSNLPFLITGLYGLSYVLRHGDRACLPQLQPAYKAFFFGVLLSGIGSCYYHAVPSNDSLIWDRLPMTIAFAGFFAIVIGEYVSVGAGRKILVPLLVAGIASVAYWALTEANGVGDLRPYAVIQFLPMLIIPAVLILYRSNSLSSQYFWVIIGLYFLAKVFENLDAVVFGLGNWMSGHTLKHLVAGLAPLALVHALKLRKPVTPESIGYS